MSAPDIPEQEGKVTAEDGWVLGYRAYVSPDSKATLLFFPAMGASTRSHIPMAKCLAAKDITVILADPRGVGMSLPRPSKTVDFGMHDRIDYDWPAFVAKAKELGGAERPLFMGGHSLGGQLSALYVSKNPGEVTGLVSAAACALSYKLWDWPARPIIYFVYHFFGLLARVFGYLPGQHVGWGRPCAGTLTREWSIWGRRGVYTKRDGSSAEDWFKEFKGAALFLSFTDDVRYAPKVAVDALAARFIGAKVTRLHKSPEELDAKEVGHFKWRSCPAVWQIIGDWILEQCETLSPQERGEDAGKGIGDVSSRESQ
ncbi:MAG: alpha/beta fold hydrolase [Planctomycetota bacterium]|nr:alpha/beta fold hydrolase [Planctomycetota bacterium]